MKTGGTSLYQTNKAMETPTQICFKEHGIMKEIKAVVSFLKREQNKEILYTRCGMRIELDQLESINGIRFS